jgi:hypothetical protein
MYKDKLEFGPEVRGMSQELASDPSRRLELQLVMTKKRIRRGQLQISQNRGDALA